MSNNTKNFVVNQNIPEFIRQDHSLYGTFIGAYYEWLELQNDSENNNHLDTYKAVGNPGYIANNQEKVVDIDETLDTFIEFFANEVVPISLKGIQTNPRFFLKHIRDLYLAKGTIQSFKLFFKLYFNDDIEVFETGDNVLKTSDGKYFNFPTAHFYVTEYEDYIDKIDFTLASITELDGTLIDTVLSGSTIGKTKAAESIIKTQFTNETTNLKSNTSYFIENADKTYKIKVQAFVSLHEITLSEKAPLYSENDPIYVDSLSLGKRFQGSVSSVSKGTVNGIKARDKGILYQVGDIFEFENNGNIQGKFTVTKVGLSGEILEINNIPLRTGITNNGFFANNLEDVYLPISNGGSNWIQLPKIKYSANNSAVNYSNPYPKTINSPGIGFQSIPLSSNIGTVNSIAINQETYFKDSDDVIMNPPATVIVENNTLQVGNKVSFQRFGKLASYEPFTDDSESVTLKYLIRRDFGTTQDTVYIYKDSEKHRTGDLTVVYGFDSDTFAWKTRNVHFDTRNPGSSVFDPIINFLGTEDNISYKTYNYGIDIEILSGGRYPSELNIYYSHSFENPTPVDFYFVHYFDSLNNEINRTEAHEIYYIADGNDARSALVTIDSTNGLNIFDDIKNFVDANDTRSVSIESSYYPDNTIDAGLWTAIGVDTDSEYFAGNSFVSGDYASEILGDKIIADGGDSFAYANFAVSHLRIYYDKLEDYDSEIEGGQRADLYYRIDENTDTWGHHTIRLNSGDDSEIFNEAIAFMQQNNVGDMEISASYYVDNALDGQTFSTVPDSEYSGNTDFSVLERADVIDGGTSYKANSFRVSHLRATFNIDPFDSDYDAGTVDFDDYIPHEEYILLRGSEDFDHVGGDLEVLEIEYHGKSVSELEQFHFDQLDELKGIDSDFISFDWTTTKGQVRLPSANDDMGEWTDTGYFGEVVGISHNNQVAKIVSYGDSLLPDQGLIDSWSFDKYNVIKVSPLDANGVSLKDYSLPLTNVVHQIDRMTLNFKTSVVSNMFSKFYNSDGFVSDDSMSLRDNYYFSDHSYRIKTQLPFETWKSKFKTLLHPAGMVLTSNYSQNLEAKTKTFNADIEASTDLAPFLTFDQNQEYVDIKGAYSTNADNIYYKSNAFESLNNLNVKARQLDGSSQTSLVNLAIKQQHGNAFWDYEPIGWIKKGPIVVNATGSLNLDSDSLFINRFTTQDSDGFGLVKTSHTYYTFYDGSKQDFFKNQSRLPKRLQSNYMVSKVQFEDAGFAKYSVYDSELPKDFVSTFNDSDVTFKGIDYDRLKSVSETRYFPQYLIPRTAEISIRKEQDLRLAMRENGSLVWDDSDVVYTDYEAYEHKWNYVNNRRTHNVDGYSIKGYQPYVGFSHIDMRSNQRNAGIINKDQREFSLANAPFTKSLWNTGTIHWDDHYRNQINNTNVVPKYEQETFKDPRVSMRGRRK